MADEKKKTLRHVVGYRLKGREGGYLCPKCARDTDAEAKNKIAEDTVCQGCGARYILAGLWVGHITPNTAHIPEAGPGFFSTKTLLASIGCHRLSDFVSRQRVLAQGLGPKMTHDQWATFVAKLNSLMAPWTPPAKPPVAKQLNIFTEAQKSSLNSLRKMIWALGFVDGGLEMANEKVEQFQRLEPKDIVVL